MADLVNEYKEISLKNINIIDGFWKERSDLINDKVIPYQYKALNDDLEEGEPSHAIENFKIAAGKTDSDFYGRIFQDSDVAKWLESVGYSLQNQDNSELEKKADAKQYHILPGITENQEK